MDEHRDRSVAKVVNAYVGLGSNLGDREATLRCAVAALAADAEVRVVGVSRLYETDPVGPPPQGPFLNGAIEIETSLSPLALLETLQRLEDEAGRVRERVQRWSARTLDLDILLYGSETIDQEQLRVPHAHLAQRAFVLEPLAELAPLVVHPTTGDPIEVLAERVRDPAAVRELASESWRKFIESSVSADADNPNNTNESNL